MRFFFTVRIYCQWAHTGTLHPQNRCQSPFVCHPLAHQLLSNKQTNTHITHITYITPHTTHIHIQSTTWHGPTTSIIDDTVRIETGATRAVDNPLVCHPFHILLFACYAPYYCYYSALGDIPQSPGTSAKHIQHACRFEIKWKWIGQPLPPSWFLGFDHSFIIYNTFHNMY